MKRVSTTFLLAALLSASSLLAGDWPGWRGPDRTAHSTETGLLATWPKDGPKLVWQSDKAGLGYAGMAIVGGTVYTMGARGSDEYLIALDGKGQEKWATKIGPIHDWKDNSWSRGPNATPTIDGGMAYGLSSKGMLLCARISDGTEVWRLDVAKDLSGDVNDVGGGIEKFGWGYSWSPLVDGDKLVIVPGGPKGLFAALDKKTGKVLWHSKGITEAATYVSPVVATIAGTKQYVYLTQKSLVGVSAKDGTVLWKHTREEDYPDIVAQTPIVKDDQVYVSAGKAGGSDLFKITASGDKFKVETVWSNKVLNNYHSGVVLAGSHLYGYNEARSWVCQSLATGELTWPKRTMRQPIKAGGIVVAEGRLYVLGEAGDRGEPGTAAMLDASPKGFKVISQFKLPAFSKERKSAGGVWTHPSLSEGKLYLRDQELVFCYQVK